MRTALALTVALAGCYTPPDLPVVPYEAPILSGDGTPVEVCAPERDARVGCTIDGDTVDLDDCGEDGERLRLLGIDAPETAKPGTPAECYADLAEAELRRVVGDEIVRLAFDRDCVDVFGERTLAYLWLDQTTARARLGEDETDDVLAIHGASDDPDARVLVNTYLLLEGWVRRYDEEWVEPLRWEAEFIAAERLAQVRGNRLWSACE